MVFNLTFSALHNRGERYFICCILFFLTNILFCLLIYRSDILSEQKQRLQAEISNLLSRKRQLTEKAHELAEKYEEANDRQTQLVQR